MSTSTQVMEIFNIFSKTYSKEDAQILVKDIEQIVDTKNKELATKEDIREVKGEIREVELKLTKEIETVRKEIKEVELRLIEKIGDTKSSTIAWVVGWVAGLLIAYTGAMFTLFMLFKK